MPSYLLFILFSGALAAPQAAPPTPEETKTRAISRGVDWLVQRQQPTGAIHDPALATWQTTMTSLSIMALMSVGHEPADRTREGETLRRALAYVLRPDRRDANGYFGGVDGSLMYGQGIIALMLSEAIGMGVDETQDALIRDTCRKAVDVIVRAQKVPKAEPRWRGGWRHGPDAPDSDIVSTTWPLMALRAAQNAGLEVPKETIDEAVAFLRRSYYSQRGADGRPLTTVSACGYQPGDPPTYTNPVQGLVALQMCGEYDAAETKGSIIWLRSHLLNSSDGWVYYWSYFYAQAMCQQGGAYAEEARQHVEKTLLPLQSADGSWGGSPAEAPYGRVYATSLSILSLAVKHHFLPIYQR